MKKAFITVENFNSKKLINRLMKDNIEYELSENKSNSMIISFETKEDLKNYVTKMNPVINGLFFLD